MVFPQANGREVPSAVIRIDAAAAGMDAHAVINGLQERSAICVFEKFAGEGQIVVFPEALRPGEAAIIGRRLRDILGRTSGSPMRYLHLLLAVASLGMLGVLHKVADHRRCRPQAINLLLFLCASFLLGLTAFIRSGPAAVFALPGASSRDWRHVRHVRRTCHSEFPARRAFRQDLHELAADHLSMAVPTALSILIYREQVTPKRALSMTLTVAALVLLWIDRRQEERKANPRPVSDGNERGL